MALKSHFTFCRDYKPPPVHWEKVLHQRVVRPWNRLPEGGGMEQAAQGSGHGPKPDRVQGAFGQQSQTQSLNSGWSLVELMDSMIIVGLFLLRVV